MGGYEVGLFRLYCVSTRWVLSAPLHTDFWVSSEPEVVITLGAYNVKVHDWFNVRYFYLIITTSARY